MSLYVGPNSPEILVEIDVTNDPTTGTMTWTDVTSDVRHAEWQRAGRSHELNRTQAGSLTVVLNNQHAYFDTTDPLSPYYPGFKLSRRIRVSAVWASTTYIRWTGFIESIEQEWPGDGRDAICVVRAVDNLAILNYVDLVGLEFDAGLTTERYNDILLTTATAGWAWTTGQLSIAAIGPLGAGSSALSAIQDAVEWEGGHLSISGAGVPHFADRHYRLVTSTSTTSQGTIGDLPGEIRYVAGALTLDDQQLWNDVQVTPTGGTAEQSEDTPSQIAHWQRTLQRATGSASQTEAASTASYLASIYSDPSPRIPSIELMVARDTSAWPIVLAANNGYRFTWRRRATGHTIEADVFVEGISEVVVPGRDWRVTFHVSPAIDLAGWVLGDAINGLLGETTVLVY